MNSWLWKGLMTILPGDRKLLALMNETRLTEREGVRGTRTTVIQAIWPAGRKDGLGRWVGVNGPIRTKR